MNGAVPSALASLVLRALSAVVDVVPPAGPGSAHARAACRFLLSLFVLDIFGWVCYKIVQFEAVLQVQVAAARHR